MTASLPPFMVLEGLDGAGKTTLAAGLSAYLATHFPGWPVRSTYEPNDDHAAGTYIRDVLAHRVQIAPRTLALAYALNRADHTERLIAPHIAAGGIVICDRYVVSSLAYNSGPDFSMAAVLELNAAARTPDLTIFLNASAETCYSRLGRRGGPRELFDSKLDERRARYHAAIDFLRGLGWHIVEIDANGTPQDMLTAAIGAVQSAVTETPKPA